MLLDDLKKANIDAMKAKDKDARSVISVVLTKCQLLQVEAKANGKDFNDPQVLEVIQKVLKELSDEKEGYRKVNNTERVESINHQEEVIKAYLPHQLSKEEIIEEINKLEDKSMPAIMKHFKMNFAGKVDMSLVSQIVRGL